MFLNSINNYRGIAILFIVVGHVIPIFLQDGLSYFDVFSFNILSGGTSLFVFVSGFLFHYVFFDGFKYSKYLTLKFKNIFLPYVFLSIVPALKIFYFDTDNQYFSFEEYGRLGSVVASFLSGRHMLAYWYIPFIILVFLASPIFIEIVKLNYRIQLIIIISFLCLSVFIHRPVNNINVAQSFFYYLPFYLVGIFFSQHRGSIDTYIVDIRVVILMLITFLIFLTLQFFEGSVGQYHKEWWVYEGVDYQLLSKLFFCIFLYSILVKYDFNNPIVKLLAKYSFPIFFFHPYLLFVLRNYFHGETSGWVSVFIATFLCVVICIALSYIFKMVFQKNSRYLIGY